MPKDHRGTPATVALAAAGVAFGQHAYDHDPAAPAYGPEAAATLGLDPAVVFKTLIVAGPAGLAVGVVPVDRQLDLKAMASALGVKSVTMADPAAAERSSGYVVGGISPLGQRRRLPTVLDASMRSLDTAYVSGGRRGFDVSLAPADLARLTSATFAPIAR
ncbi:MAG: Cys-tRNA(Pro) deacylase [Austwickia sp.]|jgi:Cys-tRNA(Pro)/Cys-tRNA(Cys) deacylase|nr:MAG: Cys-tRNA(Pro) deacylase [Austwickia sp.]